MKPLNEIKNPTIHLLGQDIRDIVLITKQYPLEQIIGIVQGKEHNHKEYTVRICTACIVTDILVAIDNDRVIIKGMVEIT